VHDNECDKWYACNDDEESTVKENPFGESYGMLVHEVSPPYLELVEYLSHKPLDLIPTPLTSSSPSPFLEHHSPRLTDYHVMCHPSLDLGHVNNFFHMLKENMLDVIWSLGTFGGYNPSLDHFHAYLVDLPRKII